MAPAPGSPSCCNPCNSSTRLEQLSLRPALADVRDWLDQELGLPRWSTSQRVINAALRRYFFRLLALYSFPGHRSSYRYPYGVIHSQHWSCFFSGKPTPETPKPPPKFPKPVSPASTHMDEQPYFSSGRWWSAPFRPAAGHARAFQRLDPVVNYRGLDGSWSVVLWTLLLYLPLMLMLTSWLVRIAAAPIGPKTQRVVIGMGIVSLAHLFWTMPNQLFDINLYTKVYGFYPEPSLGINWRIALYPSTIVTLLVVFACSERSIILGPQSDLP